MASNAELGEARQLLNLKIHEVSIVDRPANLREFLVVKNREDAMSYFDSNDADDGIEIIKAEDEEEKEVDDEKSKTKKDALSPAMKALVKTMAGMMKKTMTDAGSDKADIDKAMESFSKLVDDKLTEPAKKAAKQEDEEEEKKKAAKAKAKDDDKREDDDEEGKGPPLFGKDKAKKAAEPIFKIDADGGIHVSGDIAKGRRMTAGRVEKIAQLFGHTAALLKELSPDTFEKALAAIAKGDLPKDPGFDSQVRPMGPNVRKADDSENVELKKAVVEMTERLEKIEKARKGTSSVDGDGGTDENVEKGFWAGVL